MNEKNVSYYVQPKRYAIQDDEKAFEFQKHHGDTLHGFFFALLLVLVSVSGATVKCFGLGVSAQRPKFRDFNSLETRIRESSIRV